MSTEDFVTELRHTFKYDSNTGVFVRILGRGVGKRADRLLSSGNYRIIKYKGIYYRAHRLAWLFKKGVWPSRGIDHKDLDGCNNRWSNLREATHGQNKSNCRVYRNNLLGFKGVSKVLYPKGFFRARIRKNGKEYHLGVFRLVEEAKAAYDVAARKLHGEFWRP